MPLPPHWGGYRLEPEVWEFWQHRDTASTIASATGAQARAGRSTGLSPEPGQGWLPDTAVPIRRLSVILRTRFDAFAAVEELRGPHASRTKPLIVGGDPHGRGVVATANYVARQFGIHSAMSCASAAALPTRVRPAAEEACTRPTRRRSGTACAR